MTLMPPRGKMPLSSSGRSLAREKTGWKFYILKISYKSKTKNISTASTLQNVTSHPKTTGQRCGMRQRRFSEARLRSSATMPESHQGCDQYGNCPYYAYFELITFAGWNGRKLGCDDHRGHDRRHLWHRAHEQVQGWDRRTDHYHSFRCWSHCKQYL